MLSLDPFVSRYFVCTRFDRRYQIPSSSSLATNMFTCLCDVTTPMTKSHDYNLYDVISPVGLEYISVNRMDKSSSDLFAYSSTYLHRNTQGTHLWPPYFSVMVNALKAS